MLTWVHEVLGVGTLKKNKKPRKGKTKRWHKILDDNIVGVHPIVVHSEMHIMCVVLIWPWAHTKLP